jgi:hypothetical protein
MSNVYFQLVLHDDRGKLLCRHSLLIVITKDYGNPILYTAHIENIRGIGNNRNRAYDIFEALQGTTEVNEQHVLFIDFMETVDGLPMNLKMIGCTLSQLAESCKFITKELFKLHNLEEI